MDTFISLIKNACHQFADKTAIQFYRKGVLETRLTYKQLDQESDLLAKFFLNLGVNKNDRVILLVEKSVIFVISHLALQKIGSVSVPLNPGFKASEISYFIKDASPSLILTGKEQSPVVQQINPKASVLDIDSNIPYHQLSFFRSSDAGKRDVKSAPVNLVDPAGPDDSGGPSGPGGTIGHSDPALIIYTSGTTGKPKGAVLTQENLRQDTINIIKTWDITTEDTLCHALPLFHIHGLCFALHTCLASGSKINMLDAFNAQTVTELLANKSEPDKCTVFMAVPAMYNMLVSHIGDRSVDFSHLRLITSGSAPLLTKDFEKITQIWGQEPIEREGMSETGMNFSNPLNGIKKPGSIGIPLPELEARVVEPETLKDVPTGQIGEFWLRSPAITPGYWEKVEETKKTFKDGWFRTGDLGYVDEDGYYFLTDRIKNIIISGGENISPKEIESVINKLDLVSASAVVGIPDEKWGEKVVAAIVSDKKDALTTQEVTEHCKAYLHPWKSPKQIVFVDALPKNTMGKILIDEVRQLFENNH